MAYLAVRPHVQAQLARAYVAQPCIHDAHEVVHDDAELHKVPQREQIELLIVVLWYLFQKHLRLVIGTYLCAACDIVLHVEQLFAENLKVLEDRNALVELRVHRLKIHQRGLKVLVQVFIAHVVDGVLLKVPIPHNL